MKFELIFAATILSPLAFAALTVDVNSMPRVVFTGDSQTCGRVGALDYPQMLSWEMPVRVINTAVGGTNTTHLLNETRGGTAEVKAGEKVVHGTRVGWHAGPYPGQTVRLGEATYTIDRIEVESYADRRVNLWITEPAREDFSGTDLAVEPGWRVRVAEQAPDYVCYMYTVNDAGATSEDFLKRIAEIARRTQELGAQPVFLSGVPLMDSEKGGSHPGHNGISLRRPSDLAAFCRDENIPYGDVFRTLMLMDEPCTTVWADTVHPTTDGSATVLTALRYLFVKLGLAGNPYFLRAYRAPAGPLRPPDPEALSPITTSQPDYTADNRPVDNEFDLHAIHMRDEYGLLARGDGECITSTTPVMVRVGVGARDVLTGAKAIVVTASAAELHWFDWEARQWVAIARGVGELAGDLSGPQLDRAHREGSLWLAVSSGDDVSLDYAGVTIEGPATPYKAMPGTTALAWPDFDALTWREEPDALIRNGDFSLAEDGFLTGWHKRGAEARYLPAGEVAAGRGDFVADKRVDLFRGDGQNFTGTVRPLDTLVTESDADDATGRFIIREVVDDHTLRVRRYPRSGYQGLDFRVMRSSGCLAVASGCSVETTGDSRWEQVITDLPAGRYSLTFMHRAYDPANMNAKHVPGAVAKVSVGLGANHILRSAEGMASAFHWQKAALEFTHPGGELRVSLGALGPVAAQYTGVALVQSDNDAP